MCLVMDQQNSHQFECSSKVCSGDWWNAIWTNMSWNCVFLKSRKQLWKIWYKFVAVFTSGTLQQGNGCMRYFLTFSIFYFELFPRLSWKLAHSPTSPSPRTGGWPITFLNASPSGWVGLLLFSNCELGLHFYENLSLGSWKASGVFSSLLQLPFFL